MTDLELVRFIEAFRALAGDAPAEQSNPYMFNPWDEPGVDPSNLDDVVHEAVSRGWDAGCEEIKAKVRAILAEAGEPR